MLILGIDTCGSHASVALLEGGELVAEERLPEGSRASREALPAIERILAARRLRVEDLDAFAAVRGPGSFTGLRVGLATARGLALASGRPAAGICALDLLAEQAPPEASRACALIDARQGEVYAGFYRRAAARWEREGEYRLLGSAEIAPAGGAGIYIGSGADALRDLLEDAAAGRRVAPHRPWLAAGAARALDRALAAGRGADPESLRPLYIRPSQAERARPGSSAKGCQG